MTIDFDEARSQIDELLAADEPTLEDLQRAGHLATRARQQAAVELQQLEYSRPTVVLEGTDDELREHDEKIRAAERAVDRWEAIRSKRIQPLHTKAAEARRQELAEAAVAELPDLIRAAERAQEAFLVAQDRVSVVAGRVAGAGVKLKRDLRERVEKITEKSPDPGRHGLSVGE